MFLQALNGFQPPVENSGQKKAGAVRTEIDWPQVQQAEDLESTGTFVIDRPNRKRSFPPSPNQVAPYSPFLPMYPINPYLPQPFRPPRRTAQDILQDKYLVRLILENGF